MESQFNLNKNLKKRVIIEHLENIQFFRVQNIKNHLLENLIYPSKGSTALHTAWVLYRILEKKDKNKKH